MRLKLTLQHEPNQVLPVNYQYLISSWIYKTLATADQTFATWLHHQGYGLNGRKYKLFTFSPLQPAWFDLDRQNATISLSKSPTVLTLSFHMDKAMENFVIGLFQQQSFTLQSGRMKAALNVAALEILPQPLFRHRMRFRLLTPLCVSQNVEGKTHAQYLHPEDKDFDKLLIQNLKNKQRALHPQLAGLEEWNDEGFPYDYVVLSRPKAKLLHIKGTKIKGYLCDFELTAPSELLEIGYFSGFGEKNSSLGMGMVEVLK